MVDLSKCLGNGCPLKENCYRYKAQANKKQSYFATVPYNELTGDCDYFWDIKYRKNAEKSIHQENMPNE